MNKIGNALFGVALPIAILLTVVGAHGVVLAWTDFFTNIWNSIVNTITKLFNPGPTLSVQLQFAKQLSLLENNTQNITSFYLSNAKSYKVPTNQSWALEVTDQNTTNSTLIGQLTVVWYAPTQNLTFTNGIVNTSVSPLYAVTLTHTEFMSFSQTVAKRDIIGALADYSAYWLPGKITYTRVR